MTDALAERRALKDRVLEAALLHAAFDGWSRRTLVNAAPMPASTRRRRGGCSRRAATACWHGSTTGPIGACSRRCGACDLERLPVRRRIALLVRSRLEPLTPHREAIRRAVAARGMPGNVAGTGALAVAHGRSDVADGGPGRRAGGRVQLLFPAGHAGRRAGRDASSTGWTTSRRLRRQLGLPRSADRGRDADRACCARPSTAGPRGSLARRHGGR